MAAEKLYKWLNFTALGMRLVVTTMPTGDKRLVMMGGDKYPAQLSRLGFTKISGLWMRRDIRIDLASVRREFPDKPGTPRVFSQDMKRSDIVRVMRDKSAPTNEEVEIKIALTKAIPLGLNYLGQEVFEGSDGRFIRQQEKTVVRETDNTQSLFLRASTDQDIELCADGLMRSVMAGRIYRTEDVLKFAEVIYGKPTEQSAPEMSKLHAALGHALARRILTEPTETEDEKFALAVKLHEALPPVSAEFAEKIVTMPMGLIAQTLVNVSSLKDNAVIRIPSVGNGAFISALRGATIQAGDVGNTNELSELSGNVFTGLTNEKYDVAMENLSYAIMDEEVDVDGLKIRRQDHLDIIKSLNSRKPNGLSVFAFRAPAIHGEVDEDTKRLLSWVSARYEIDGMVQMDSHLLGKGSATGNRYMLSVGKRGSRIFDGPGSLKVVYDYEALRDWSDETVAKRDSSAEHRKRIIEENALQAPYLPSSQVSEPKAMVPRNLVGPTREALARIEARVGNIDNWVAEELGYNIDDLGSYLDAEQVDAVAMGIDAQLRGRGFIEADQTGLGKGRVLAALTRWAIINGQKVIFVTEKPNLFSDFFRDLTDIDSTKLINHRCINQGVSIRLNGTRLHGPTKKEDIESMINDGAIPDDVNLVMATYSQFNRPSGDANGMEKKSAWLPIVAADAMLILDEAHNAAGTTSNTGVNIAAAVARSKNVVYSSATYAKGAKNFSVYSKVMPDSIKGANVGATLASGGEPLMEVFSANLVRDGVLIRREHDMSELQFIDEVDTRRRERNEDLANKMANILEVMGLLSGEIETFVNTKNKMIKAAEKNKIKSGAGKSSKRNGFVGVNFGARLYALQRQFMLSLGVDLAAENAIKSLDEGRKPVVVLEQTMESLLRDALAKREELLETADDEMDDDEEDNEISDTDAFDALDAEIYTAGTRVLDAPVTFRDVLRKSLDRMCIVRHVTDTTTTAERLEIESVKKFRASIELLIDAFPDMPASPIDVIRDRIERAGYSCSEISGRSIGLADNDDGTQSVIAITGTSDKVGVIDKFNSGIIDAVVLTTAGSTGISLHASENFRDQRQRELIELQIANDVAVRMQFFGRVNRKGQVCPPIIRTLCSGLPSENRLLSMQNMKMRALSANTTSNQDSSNLALNIPDLLNEVGSEVCRKYLLQNIPLAKRLAIKLEKLSDEAAKKQTKPTWYADQLTGRLGMIMVQEQLEVYDEITVVYNTEIAEMEARGVNPFKTSEYDVGARIVSRTVLQGATGGESVFDEPVYLTQIEFDEKVDAITSTDIRGMANKSLTDMYEDPRVNQGDRSIFGGVLSILKDTEHTRLERALSGEFTTVAEALAAEGNNIVKSIKARFTTLKDKLPSLQPGKAVTFTDALGEHVGIITRMSMPTMGREHLLGEYDMRIHRPGDAPVVTTLNGFLNMGGRATYNEHSIIMKFDQVQFGTVVRKRTLMDGNMFMAANKARTEGFGTSVVYTDEQGTRQRGILLPKSLPISDLIDKSGNDNVGMGREFAAEVIMQEFAQSHTFTNSKYNYGSPSIAIERQNQNEYVVAIANKGPTADLILANRGSMSLVINPVKKGEYTAGTVDQRNMNKFITMIYDSGFVMFAPPELAPLIEAKRQGLVRKTGPAI